MPQPVDTFEELRERFGVASHLLQNLAQVGYRIPTGIQSHGIPILLEVRTLCRTCLLQLKRGVPVERPRSYLPHRNGKDSVLSASGHESSWGPSKL